MLPFIFVASLEKAPSVEGELDVVVLPVVKGPEELVTDSVGAASWPIRAAQAAPKITGMA